MKLIIAGGRNYLLTESDYSKLDAVHAANPVTTVVSGCARGADTCGESWARQHKIAVKKMPADWQTHGKSAGPIRNREMAEFADAVALFPGGRGTANMFLTAKALGLKIYDFRG